MQLYTECWKTQQYILVLNVLASDSCVRDLLPVLHPETLTVVVLSRCEVALECDWWGVITHHMLRYDHVIWRIDGWFCEHRCFSQGQRNSTSRWLIRIANIHLYKSVNLVNQQKSKIKCVNRVMVTILNCLLTMTRTELSATWLSRILNSFY